MTIRGKFLPAVGIEHIVYYIKKKKAGKVPACLTNDTFLTDFFFKILTADNFQMSLCTLADTFAC